MQDDIFLQTLVKSAENEWAVVMSEGEETNINRYINTGSLSFNALLSGSLNGGAAGNRVMAIAGEPSTGKTYFALSMCRTFLEDNPNGYIFFFESEHAVDKDTITSRGIPEDKFTLLPVETIQDFRTQALRIVNKYLEFTKEQRESHPVMFVLDSLGNLSTEKEMEDIEKGAGTRDMTRAQLIRGCFRALNLKMGRAGIPLILTNHVYEVIGSYVPTKDMGGGQGAKYAASTIVFLTKKKERGDDGVTGVVITATLQKSRLTIENKKVEVLLDYKKGLNKYYGLTDLCVKFGIWNKTAKQIEIDGKKFYEKAINSEPEKFFTPEVLEKLETACKEEFLYGRTDLVKVEEAV